MNILEVFAYLKSKILHADEMAPKGNPFDPELFHHKLEKTKSFLPEQRKKKHIATYVWVEKPLSERRREFRHSIIKAKKMNEKRKQA